MDDLLTMNRFFQCVITPIVAAIAVCSVAGCSPGRDTAIPSTFPPSENHAAAVAHPNVVVLMLDTLRPDYLDLHGFERETAPFLRELAAKSVVFEHAYSTSSWTAPSTASLMTGLYPPQHGLQLGYHQQRIEQGVGSHENLDALTMYQTLPDQLTTMAELFQQSGYETSAISANINIQSKLQFEQGFDWFRYENLLPAEDFARLVTESNAFFAERSPFFLYLHLMDPHIPYHQRAPYFQATGDVETDYREAYLSEIRYMDDHLRTIVESLEPIPNTVFWIVTDHGEEFRDHGGLNHGPTLYRELNQILLMAYYPEAGWEPRRVETNVSLIDVLPTFIEAFGLNATSQQMQGVSLVPLLRGAEPTEDLTNRTLFAHRVAPQGNELLELWAAINGPWKLIDDPRRDEPLQLYDRRSDPAEQTNLQYTNPDERDRLNDLLAVHRREKRLEADRGYAEPSEDLNETLEALGYVN